MRVIPTPRSEAGQNLGSLIILCSRLLYLDVSHRGFPQRLHIRTLSLSSFLYFFASLFKLFQPTIKSLNIGI
jgi:hypothetical protein